ncbi:MAG: hypothetical protein IJ870_01630 [Alphaproteobacteria bacterium]|nr:hypothetical protein [Alphaproteobacteria bacterium]
MGLHFFTLGGTQFWEDVFYYQKWRIQRHFRTRKYRLLDNWDICRATGTFEECREAFVRLIEVFEIPRQSGRLVILLHGLGESKNTFKSLWRALEKQGYHVAAINYPSTRKSIKAHLDQLDFFLTHTEDVDEVSFVTKGTSCLLLRYLLNTSFAWNKKFKIGKIVNVNPTNIGSDACAAMAHSKILTWIFGPALKECAPVSVHKIPKLPMNIPLGLVFCETYKDKILKPFIKRYEGIKVPGDLTEDDFSPHRVRISNSQLNIFDNPKVVEQCLRFLDKGTF